MTTAANSLAAVCSQTFKEKRVEKGKGFHLVQFLNSRVINSAQFISEANQRNK